MQKRSRFEQTASLQNRPSAYANDVREKAISALSSVDREDLLKRARQFDTALHLNEWANSFGLQPPK